MIFYNQFVALPRQGETRDRREHRMRFPELLQEVQVLRDRIATYETDISYCMNKIRSLQNELNHVRALPPDVPRETVTGGEPREAHDLPSALRALSPEA